MFNDIVCDFVMEGAYFNCAPSIEHLCVTMGRAIADAFRTVPTHFEYAAKKIPSNVNH